MSAPPAKPVQTTCAYCGVGCGIVVETSTPDRFEVRGDPGHPANYGRLCAKGKALGDTLTAEGRLLYPEIGGERVSWEDALTRVADRFTATIDEYGPDSVAFYVSGQLLTEDYYVANKLMKGFIGSANIDTNSRLCMASSVAGHKRAFGEDIVPGTYEDLETADLVVLVGSNLAWCHPVLHQRLIAARETSGSKLVVIDPRTTATSADCDLHLALKPGSDVALFNGLLRYLIGTGACDDRYISEHTNDWAATADRAAAFDIAAVSELTGLDEPALLRFYAAFAGTPRVVTVYSQGVNQSVAGTDKVNAIINCHLATGRIGLPGAGPFSVTGQPNAMGGRETGGLANTLASHIEFDDPEGVEALAGFWSAPAIARKPGLKAVDLFDAVADGRIRALWIMATNPAVSLPDSTHVRDALAACPFVVVSDVVRRTDTSVCADVVLPAAGWGEKDGTVTNSERRVSRQRRFVDAPGEARPDWWIVSRVGQAMGYPGAFDFDSPDEIFREYARSTTLAGAKPRRLNLGALSDLSARDYDALTPFVWPAAGDDNVLADANTDGHLLADGHFPTADGRANFVPVAWRAPALETSDRYPLRITSGRIRDQWHTMTRSGLAAQLSAHIAEPYVEIHPVTASRYGIRAADIVVVDSPTGNARVRALVTERVGPDRLFVPMHWSDQNAACGAANRLFGSYCDPVSGQPELKHGVARVRRLDARWYGFAVSRARPADPQTEYWVRMKCADGWRIEMADTDPSTDFARLFRSLCGPLPHDTDIATYEDRARRQVRYAAVCDGRVLGVLYVAPEPVAAVRSWITAWLTNPGAHGAAAPVLAGSPPGSEVNQGALICSCNGIGRATIIGAVRDGHVTVEDVGRHTRAGTSCGSCRMEIRGIIDSLVAAAAS